MSAPQRFHRLLMNPPKPHQRFRGVQNMVKPQIQTAALRNVDHEARSVSKPAGLSRVDMFRAIASWRIPKAEEFQKSANGSTDQAKLYFAGQRTVIPFLRHCGRCPPLHLWQHARANRCSYSFVRAAQSSGDCNVHVMPTGRQRKTRVPVLGLLGTV